ncbi:MAG: sigma factor-like helix-turn-helix DNA-binding protein [Eubacteriales bacterium]|nr:sigma factor-like helix-turn-helix DNA-binding protein [Eubacteriales bacterium]
MELSIQEENEKKKEFLRSYCKSLRREKRIEEDIQELRMNKMFPSVVNDGMPRGSEQSDLSNYIVKLDEMIEELKNERLERAKLRQRIERDIQLLDNEDEQEVLRLRYIKGLKWEEVAVETGYTYRRTLQIHGKALQNLKISA